MKILGLFLPLCLGAATAWPQAAASEIQISRKDIDHLLIKNAEMQGRKLDYQMTCNIDRMGRMVTFNGGCINLEIFKNFINKNSNDKINIELDFKLRLGALSVLFAPDDFMGFPQYSSTTKIAKSCDLIRVQNKERGTRFIRVGPDGKNAIRCLTLGLLRDMGVSIMHSESDPMSKDYLAFYHPLVGPRSDFKQSVEYVREKLNKDDVSMIITE